MSDTILQDAESPPLNKEETKFVQAVVGSFLCYAHTIDMIILHTLSTIALEQSNSTKRTMKRVNKLLDYMCYTSHAVISFDASDIIMNVHSDAPYLSVGKGRTRTGGYFSLVTCHDRIF